MKEVRTRYAPSPTGYMHIGNLRTALYEYLVAKVNNGKFVLRIEDTDQSRYVKGAVDVVYSTLKIAGIEHDEGPDIGGEYGPYVQSQRKDLYLPYAKQLIDKGKAYYCLCTRERLDEMRRSLESENLPPKYDKCCMSLSRVELEEKLSSGYPYVIRQKMPEKGITSYEDAVYGTISIDNKELDDQILIKSDGLPTYNFANVIDDHLMKITHVVRGSEYLTSTPKYNLLYEAFGWDIPVYIHLPLINKPGGGKLSKRTGDPSFEDLIEMGYMAEAVVNYVALLGWSPGDDREFFSLESLCREFNIKGISKSPAIFDIKKLTWMNGEYIRKLSLDKFHQLALPYYKKASLTGQLNLIKLSEVLQKRTETFGTIPENIDFLAKLPDYDTSLYIHKKMKTNEENSLVSLKAIIPIMESIDKWENDVLFEKLAALAREMGVKNGVILWPLRTALSGKPVSPGGGTELAEIMGREETLERINIGIDKLKKQLSS